MKRSRFAWIVPVCMLIASLAAGSEQSKILSSRGLIEFHASRYEQARSLFDQALATDPNDTAARYYRAATRARLNDYDGAIADLEAVLALQPDFGDAALDLGVAYIETAQYEKALPWLERAQRSPALAARASLFLGLAQLRLHQPQPARRNFEQAASDPDQRLTARYYEGVAAYEDGDWRHAKVCFNEVVGAGTSSALGKESATFLTEIADRYERWYQAYARTALQYDSNVILAPSSGGGGAESTLAVSQQDDGRTTFAAGAGFVPVRTDTAELFLGYDVFQSVYFQLHEFDLQAHSATAQMAGGDKRLRMGLAARYDYYLLDWDSFLQDASASPWLMVALGEYGRSEVYYRMRRRDYKQLVYKVRDAFNHAAGTRHFLYLGSPDRYLVVGHQFDYEDPVVSQVPTFSKDEARSFGYIGNEVNAAMRWLFPFDIVGELGYIYRHERYASESELYIPDGSRRIDNEHQVVVAIRKQFTRHLGAALGYLGDFNTSRNVDYDYDRQIVSISMEVNL